MEALQITLKLKKGEMISKLKFLPDSLVAFGFVVGVGSGSVTTIASNVMFKLDSNAPLCDASTKFAATFPNSSNDNAPEKGETSPDN